ncbi:MAG: DNA mismatch repair protein MutS [Firmicutes bacterium]|nr:DNA mismatch repair protein MutS [Bacillota bacterium]
MLQQYYAVKEQYRDAIVLFRLGDFYEMFDADAQVASRVLEITLTSRDAGKAERIPMCGVPYHAVEGYIAQLLANGFKVAICDQMEDPRLAKGVVKREVTRVITPGTVIERASLEEKRNNFLVAINPDDHGNFGLAYADVSTGAFAAAEIRGAKALERLVNEFVRLQPSECLWPSGQADAEGAEPVAMPAGASVAASEEDFPGADAVLPAVTRVLPRLFVTRYDPQAFSRDRAYRGLTRHLGTVSLEGFGCESLPLAIGAAGAVIAYLQETQKTNLGHINRLATYTTDQFMTLDVATRRNLELTQTIRDGNRKGSLLWVLDRTVTSMGGRMLRDWVERPLVDPEAVRRRLSAVQTLVDDILFREELRELLAAVYDLERLVSRVTYGVANGRDLVALRDSCAVLPGIKEVLRTANASAAGGVKDPWLGRLEDSLDALADIAELLRAAITDNPPISVREGDLIKAGYNAEVDQLREASTSGKSWIAELEAREREATGIKSLKVGFNKVFGYYLEVTNANRSLIPDRYLRKQTLANAERFITPELKEYENRILGAEERLVELEYQLFVEVRQTVAKAAPRIQQTAGVLAQLDVLAALATVAVANGYVRPVLDDSDEIKIVEGRHPVVEKMLQNGLFVPNDCLLDHEENQFLLITGPNMAGKSTFMRQVALIVLMAQVGSFVPAAEARIGVVDRVFTRVGAADDLATGQSTFMVEMNEVANILNNATRKSLVILDEIGRGTSTFDGLSIAWAVTEYLHDPVKVGAKTLFATHYHELTDMVERLPHARNYSVAVEEEGESIVFLRRIIAGGTDRSYGIEVARLAGLPGEILQRAKEVLSELEGRQEAGGAVVQAAGTLEAGIQEAGIREAGLEAGLAYDAVAAAGPEKSNLVQLALFDRGHSAVVEELCRLDVANLTPIEAINTLHQLQQKALAETGKSKRRASAAKT